jgi:predicted glycosyltransferase
MNILFDFVHPADVNLFKQSIISLKRDKHNVILTLRKRGALQRIAEFEFPEFKINIVGSHQKTLLNKLLAYIGREIRFFKILRKNKINVAICQGVSFGISGKILKIPIINHDDDHEYKLTYMVGKYLATNVVMPEFMPVNNPNFIKYKGFKELAYLHPKYFKPDISSLDLFGLTAFKYVFIREISNVSLNYNNRLPLLNEILTSLNSNKHRVILSLEDKKLISYYDKEATVLKEPVDDLYSLMYYSKFVISSGDTMARESSLLGVPCIYTGGRMMSVNNEFIQMGIMLKSETMVEIKKKIEELCLIENDLELRKNMSTYVLSNYDDLNTVFLKQILNISL